MVAHVITFEVGNVLDDPNWQAPVYCFGKDKKQRVIEEFGWPSSFPLSFGKSVWLDELGIM